MKTIAVVEATKVLEVEVEENPNSNTQSEFFPAAGKFLCLLLDNEENIIEHYIGEDVDMENYSTIGLGNSFGLENTTIQDLEIVIIENKTKEVFFTGEVLAKNKTDVIILSTNNVDDIDVFFGQTNIEVLECHQ